MATESDPETTQSRDVLQPARAFLFDVAARAGLELSAQLLAIPVQDGFLLLALAGKALAGLHRVAFRPSFRPLLSNQILRKSVKKASKLAGFACLNLISIYWGICS